MIHVFIGTKAQYIKTAPLIRLMDARGVEYRLSDSGQHAALSVELRAELGVRPPDYVFAADRDVASIPAAVRWAGRLAGRLLSAARLREDVFGGYGGICVVHGDTPSTLLSAAMARRAGLRVAHIEAGLRSHRLLHPFPEELIRVVVMRMANLLFAPDADAVANLTAMGIRGEVVPLAGNTSIEAVRYAAAGSMGRDGPAIFTMHRVENLHRRARVEAFVELLERAAALGPIRLVMHEPTRAALEGHLLDRIQSAGVETVPLVPHTEFVGMLAAAPYVVTDGGSVQEECALLGVPTLLWRERTERANGLDHNVVLSRYRPAVVRSFLEDPDRRRRVPVLPDVNPSEQVLDRLVAMQ